MPSPTSTTHETNYYASDNGTTANASYIQGGDLSKIEYGLRRAVYGTTPAAEVTFTVNGRCSTSATGCDTSTWSSSTASNGRTCRTDLTCASGASCDVISRRRSGASTG